MSHAFEAELSTQYTDIRQRLRDGNGHAKIDHPIDLRPGYKKPPSIVVLMAEIAKLSERLTATEKRLQLMSTWPVGVLRQILNLVAETEGMQTCLIVGGQRKSDAVKARFLGIYLSAMFTTKTLAQIGEVYGHRDHTTIIHGRDVMKARIAADPELKNKVEWYAQRIALFDKH